MQNYKPKKTRIDGILFDSALEAKAYKMLCQVYGRDKIKCHHPLILGNENLEHYIHRYNHKVDFLVETAIGKVYLEIKGKLKGEWKGKAEYIKLLHEITRLENIEYVLWTGNGDLGFEGKDELYFAWSFPKTLHDVTERMTAKYHDVF
jgi:hypothetical protein